MEYHGDVDISDLFEEPKKRKRKFESLVPVSSKREDDAKQGTVPDWFVRHLQSIGTEKERVEAEIVENTRLDMASLERKFGGKIQEIPFEILSHVIRRSDDPFVDREIKIMSQRYYRLHPDENPALKNQYYITYDGRIIPDTGQELTPAQKREITVGTTCFHYNSGTPGMSDTD